MDDPEEIAKRLYCLCDAVGKFQEAISGIRDGLERFGEDLRELKDMFSTLLMEITRLDERVRRLEVWQE